VLVLRYPNRIEPNILFSAFQREPLPVDKYSRELDDLVAKMLRMNYNGRASATELLDELDQGGFCVKFGTDNNMPAVWLQSE
jgi:hypothetical protein